MASLFARLCSKDRAGGEGLGVLMTSFFLVAQMAGAGFLKLPKAIANTGFFGILMLSVFGCSICFSATRLGRCRLILEERWPEYKASIRQPYMEMAYRALGPWGRRLATFAVLTNLYGTTTVYIILTSQFLEQLQSSLSVCELVLIVGTCLVPFTWLTSPKDFWQASILAVLSTVVAVVVIIIQLFIELPNFAAPTYPNPTVGSFSLGFAACLFSLSGSAVFPTVQNDMVDKSQFWKSAVIGFSVIMSMYLPVAISGYVILGSAVPDNILFAVEGVVVQIAMILEIINLVSTYVISINPVVQCVEENLGVPNKFGIKRILLRSSLVAVQMLICLAVPNFSLILDLIGGSCIVINTFIMPPLLYIKLNDQKDPKWPERNLPLWERTFLTEIICVGVVGGICATISAFIAILDPANTANNCFVDFYGTA